VHEAYNRENMHLVDISTDDIKQITERGIRTSETEYPVDVIIFAIGFDGSTGALTAINIRGREGKSIKEYWKGCPRTYLGAMVDGFPNMFMVTGPQSPFGNIPVVSENCARWICRAIEYARGTETGEVEPSAQAVNDWVAETSDLLRRSLIREGAAAHSWLVGANIDGKPQASLFYFGRADVFFRRMQENADEGFPGVAGSPAERSASAAARDV
jgi:hypothetical protein